MKIAIFSPNLSRRATGGAETYALGLAKALLECGHEVTFFVSVCINKKNDINRVYDRYGFPHFKTIFVPFISTSRQHLKEFMDLTLIGMRNKVNREFDLFINVTQGRLVAPQNIPSIHIIHFPDETLKLKLFKRVSGYLNNRYVDSYTTYVANSYFTKKYFELYWNKECGVLYPPINMVPISADMIKRKEKIILAVDRIVPDKKVFEMILAYKKLYTIGCDDYRFVIVGGSNPKHKQYYKAVLDETDGYPIEIRADIAQDELIYWYQRASIFWHAKGYNINDDLPYEMEHFGMTTVEAMANGCVPIVINKAGQKEIVKNKFGYTWISIDELVEMTLEVIRDDDKRIEMQKNAVIESNRYLNESFRTNLQEIINNTLIGFYDR